MVASRGRRAIYGASRQPAHPLRLLKHPRFPQGSVLLLPDSGLCEYLAPGYDRYFFSLRSQVALPGFAAFDGRRLAAVREAGPTSESDYQGVLEEDGLFPWLTFDFLACLARSILSLGFSSPWAVRLYAPLG